MEFAASHRLLPARTIPGSEVQRAINIWVSGRLNKILPALAAIYLGISAVCFFHESDERSTSLNWLTYTTGVAILASWSLLRRGRITPDRVHLCASIVGALILIRSLVEFSVTSDTSQVISMVLLLLGSACTLLAWRGFTLMALLCVAGWAASAPANLPSAGVA